MFVYVGRIGQALSEIDNEGAAEMEDLIKQLSEVGEESPAFEGLMFKLERALNSDCGPGSFEEDDLDIS